jgi:hypothetical protein
MNMDIKLRDFESASMAEELKLLGELYVQIAARLSYTLAIERDSLLQKRLRTLASGAEGQPFTVSQVNRQAWLKLGECPSLHREHEYGLATVDLDDSLRSDPGLVHTLADSAARTNASNDAQRMLSALFGSPPLLSRSIFQSLFERAPVIEQLAYSCAVRSWNVADMMRTIIRRDLADGRRNSMMLKAYWQVIHSIGQLTLIASSAGARPWLAEMSRQFVWRTWTPSFVLLGERTAWLAAAAARSVIAFGDSVVESYLRRLSQAEHTMMAFDAVFGLSAIALTTPSSHAAISDEITKVKESNRNRLGTRAEFVSSFCEAASHTLARQASAEIQIPELAWHRDRAHGMATRAALIADATAPSATGGYLALSMLPVVVQTSHQEHFSEFPTAQSKNASVGEILQAFRRAWGPERSQTNGSLH